MKKFKEGDLAYRVFEGLNCEAIVSKVTILKCGKAKAIVKNLGDDEDYDLYLKKGDFLFRIDEVDSDLFFIELSRKFIAIRYARYKQLSYSGSNDLLLARAETAFRLIPSAVITYYRQGILRSLSLSAIDDSWTDYLQE